jgi:3,5-epimerase/4-reductase
MIALLWGGGGWIGGQFKEVLAKRGWTVVEAKSRADNRAAVKAEVEAVKPTHIVSLIGRTHGPGYTTIDYLEQKGKLVENMKDNLYAPLVLAGVAKEKFDIDSFSSTQTAKLRKSQPKSGQELRAVLVENEN